MLFLVSEFKTESDPRRISKMKKRNIIEKFEELINDQFKLWLEWAIHEGVDHPRTQEEKTILTAICVTADNFHLRSYDMYYTWGVDEAVDNAVKKIEEGESDSIEREIF